MEITKADGVNVPPIVGWVALGLLLVGVLMIVAGDDDEKPADKPKTEKDEKPKAETKAKAEPKTEAKPAADPAAAN